MNNNLQFMELFQAFYQKKTFIILSTFIGLLCGMAYLHVATPVYEARIKLLAPTEGDIAGFNLGRSWNQSPLKPLTVRDVYTVFNNQLMSDSVRKDFYNKNYLPVLRQSKKLPRQLYADFNKNFTVIENPRKAVDDYAKYTVTLRAADAGSASKWLEQFVAVVKEKTLHEVLKNMKQQNEVVVANLQRQIDSARAVAKAQRQDRIVQLQERLNTTHLDNSKNYWDDEPAIMNDANEALPAAQEALRAEINNLAIRKSDDAYIPSLRGLESDLAFYQNLNVNPSMVEVFHLDGTIVTPTSPIAPQKNKVLMFSLILGFMVGIFRVMLPLAWYKDQSV